MAAARWRARVRRADVVALEVREVDDFRVIVFLAVVFFGVAWLAVADWAAAESTEKPKQAHAAKTHQRREAFGKREKITDNPLGDRWLQIVSAF
jgi:hypothetical protein